MKAYNDKIIGASNYRFRYQETHKVNYNPPKMIDLESLADGNPVITANAVGFYVENCMVCFENQKHKSGVQLKLILDNIEEKATFNWSRSITQQILNAYRDLRRATDHASCAIALLLLREFTQYQAIEQANIGTTIDYYLSPKSTENDKLIFNSSAYLEVSGILQENPGNTIDQRIRSKRNRLKTNRDLPVIIIVLEFSQPWSKMVTI